MMYYFLTYIGNIRSLTCPNKIIYMYGRRRRISTRPSYRRRQPSYRRRRVGAVVRRTRRVTTRTHIRRRTRR